MTTNRDTTPWQKRRLVEQAISRRGYTTKELVSLLGVTRRTVNRILNELSCVCPVQKEDGLWFIGSTAGSHE